MLSKLANTSSYLLVCYTSSQALLGNEVKAQSAPGLQDK